MEHVELSMGRKGKPQGVGEGDLACRREIGRVYDSQDGLKTGAGGCAHD
jgi:hypothetical protein